MFIGIIDTKRFEVIELIAMNQLNQKLLCSADIEKELEMFRSSLNPILKDFTDKKLVRQRKVGKKIYYEIIEFERVLSFVLDSRKICDNYE